MVLPFSNRLFSSLDCVSEETEKARVQGPAPPLTSMMILIEQALYSLLTSSFFHAKWGYMPYVSLGDSVRSSGNDSGGKTV